MGVRFDADGEDYTRALTLGSQTLYTVCGWFKFSVDRNTWTTLWSLDTSTTDVDVIQTHEDGLAVQRFTGGGVNQDLFTATVGTWYFFALARNGAGGTFYHAAASAATLSTVTQSGHSASTTVTNLRIGESPWGGEWLNGCTAAFKFWNGVQLTQAEIEREWRQYAPTRVVDLSAFYPLVEPETTDYSGNARTLSGGTGATTEDGPPIPWRVASPKLILPHGLPGFLPSTLVEPESHTHNPPVVDSNGHRYRVGEQQLALGNHPEIHKSTDGGITWGGALDVANVPSAQDIEGSWTLKDGDTIFFISTRDDTVWLNFFRMSDHPTSPDTWGTQETVDSALSSSGVQQHACIAKLSTGAYWCFYSDLLNGSANQVGMRKRTGVNTYSSKTTFNDGAVNCCSPSAVVGENDVTYVFYKDTTADTLFYRTVQVDGTVSARVAVATGTDIASDTNPHTNPVFFMDGGVEKVGIAYINNSDILLYREIHDGVLQAQQTISTAAVTTNPGATDSQAVVAHLAVDGTTVHALWSRLSDGDLMHDSKTAAGAWGTDEVLWASGGNAGWYIYCDVITEGSEVKLIWTYDLGTHADDASNISYNETVLRTTGTTVQGSAAAAFGFTGAASGIPRTFGVAAAPFGFTGTASGVPRTSGVASAAFGFTATAAGAVGVLGAATAALGFTATAAGTVGAAPVTGSASALFGFTATASGTPRTSGTATGSFGFAGAATGVDRSLGVAVAALGFTGSAAGVDRALGSATGSLGFTATASGVPDVHGVATGSFGFTGTAQGFAGTPPVTGAAAGLFGFTATAQGQPRTLGTASASLGFTGTSLGRPIVHGAAVATFGPTLTASGKRSTHGAPQAAITFTAAATGLVIGPVVPGTAHHATGSVATATRASMNVPTATGA